MNGTKKTAMPVFEVRVDSLNGRASENIEIAGAEMTDFTTIKRPTFVKLKQKYQHIRGKTFYRIKGRDILST